MDWEQALFQQSRQNFVLETAPHANDGAFTQVTITPAGAASPLGAGLLAGTVTVTNAASGFSYGDTSGFGTGGVGVALRGDGTGVEATHASIIGYNAGTLRPDATPAPGARVAFFMGDATFNDLNATGLRLFDASAAFAGATIPEPSMFGLVSVGLAGLAALRRRV